MDITSASFRLPALWLDGGIRQGGHQGLKFYLQSAHATAAAPDLAKGCQRAGSWCRMTASAAGHAW
ncbi:hypothetical protein HaLaN_19196 [Haematococcus lacustris]|uniref:Uncharacterized protein n=1 Tax=Haematococcus lacustris TaxID=44745 RepID=A0A699ZIM3_HAELA|nr:hypothetical protein HaLaN_19196 [Haematococcus lacustris]